MSTTPSLPDTANTVGDTLVRLANVVDSRHSNKGGQPDTSYVARLLANGPDSFLKKIGEEATEVVMAAKDVQQGADKSKLVAEMADLWFHSLIALSYFGLRPEDVLAELARREGTSGIEEKALRKLITRTQSEGDQR